MIPEPEDDNCGECGCELTEDGNGQLFCPHCRFESMLSMGELDEEIVDGNEYTRVGGVTFKLPIYGEGPDEDE